MAGAFLVVCVISVGNAGAKNRLQRIYDDFEAGKVAERDVVADRPVSYVDEEATRLGLEALQAQVPAVFVLSAETSRHAISQFISFSERVSELLESDIGPAAFAERLRRDFPGYFDTETLIALFRGTGDLRSLDQLRSVLEKLYEEGIWSLPEEALTTISSSVELIRPHNGGSLTENYEKNSVMTLNGISARIDVLVANGEYPSTFKSVASSLLQAFIVENVFYSPEETDKRRLLASEKAKPVLKRIEQGESIVRKGFVVTEADIVKLQALGTAEVDDSVNRGLAIVGLLLIILGVALFLAGPRMAGRSLNQEEIYVLAAAAPLYILIVALIDLFFASSSALRAVYVPTALFAMICAVLMNPRVAVAVIVSFPLAAYVAGLFDPASFVFAVLSGASGAFMLRGVEKRMDLLKAGALLAVVHIFLAIILLFWQEAAVSVYPSILFWAAFNGLVGTLLVLGLLPLLEQALNAATTFRLTELSDLNAPILKRLLTVAPGTYSHSVMVANLAESACQEIGADALLARVGGYYHDIGKIDQPEYFIENQAAYNKHEELAPRLSATVIRSHVKLGIEKARSLRLPQVLIDIISEHHGNSVITWFYNEALKREDQVKPDDFSYPGNPPRTRESAVVMLADSVEAAIRSLKKPTMAKMEKFIQEIIMGKFSQGQLSESELTFRDLELIKKAFARVLAGYFHNRIEYPKVKEAP